MKNSLLKIDQLPKFSEINIEEIESNILLLIENAKEVVNKITDKDAEVYEYTWDNLILPIEEKLDDLSRAWGIVGHLNSVVSSEELRKVHDNLIPSISEFYTWLGQNKKLYKAYLSLNNNDSFSLLSPAQQKCIKEEIDDFVLSGVNLDDKKKEKYIYLEQKLSELSSKFSNNVLDSTNEYYKHVEDQSIVSSLPSTSLELAKQEAKARGLEGYVFTLKAPSYIPVMQFCDNRELRKELYEAYVTRASNLGPSKGKFDNTENIEEQLVKKKELVNLLGFETYADYSVHKKMAPSSDEVIAFLQDLVSRSKEKAKSEVDEIYAYAKKIGVQFVLEPWDLSFYSEKLRQEKFSINDEMVRPYFPLPKVLNGLFKLINILFGMEFRAHLGVDVWHEDVAYYDVYDKSGVHRGGVYFDLYARENKQGGAWMNDCAQRRYKIDGSLQLPVAYVIGNFIPPLNGKPSLLNHDEVETLFHEVGHAMHHVLTDVDVCGVAGISRVPWDAVELPSQFMENFTWQKEVLDMISSHVETGEKLPDELLNKLLDSKNYHSAMGMIRQLEFSLFDFLLYYKNEECLSAQQMIDKVRHEVSVTPVPEFNKFQNTFTHIFSGGYSAGYYSYKWAEVLSADVFSKFEEHGVLNQEIGLKYLNCILKNGGSKDFMKMFVDFMGRKPSISALLRHSGIE